MRFIKKHKRLLLILLVLVLLGVAMLYYLRTSHSDFAASIRSQVRDIIAQLSAPRPPDPMEGLQGVVRSQFYIDNKPVSHTNRKSNSDNKWLIETDSLTRLIDYTHGYMVDLPIGSTFDFTKSPKYTTVNGDGYEMVISRERAVGGDVEEYIDHYQNRFILSDEFQASHGVYVRENTKLERHERLTAVVEGWPYYDGYTYLCLKTNSTYYYRIMVKYHKDDQRIPAIIKQIEESFYYFATSGKAVFDLDLHPVLPTNWTAETRALYDRITAGDDILWGIYATDMRNTGIQETIPSMEEAIGIPFDVFLVYLHQNHIFPEDFMQHSYENGRIVELTYQMTISNNTDMYGTAPMMDLLRDGDSWQIRAFARSAAQWGKPFLFRLNNEMNSDWVCYGGVNNMSDPDLYVLAWREVYRIFQEEGATNAVWIWNPHDRSYPPNGWNSYIAYYPGNEYVHMFGVTGYNNGTYFLELNGEKWREFDNIYSSIEREYAGLFDAFPWIITEFASSSHGGNKAKWIEGMFLNLPKYPKIKVAVWFSAHDYDHRPGYEHIPSRTYSLDETPQTLEAFARGRRSLR